MLCIGSEWHRYPSSFFMPSCIKEAQWINEGFRGLLPYPFNSSLGGMTTTPPYFNDKNKGSHGQYVSINGIFNVLLTTLILLLIGFVASRYQTLHLLYGARFAKAISNSRK
ncbi:hypothetical protein ZIOFF_056149 [Zingiber officinale]|uniref:Uncharacterized protein n=1 Tax=Zingiber officinale TaxID=94328 RepID=A0A8J5FHQ3_ZINOF|nr:hypothetical protein ZIOFF_056149 [Zingiber officinale]